MNTWTLTGAAWLLAGTLLAIGIGAAIHNADRHDLAPRPPTAGQRPRAVTPQPTITLDGHVHPGRTPHPPPPPHRRPHRADSPVTAVMGQA